MLSETQKQNGRKRKADKLRAENIIVDAEQVHLQVQSEAVTCEYCDKLVHPDNLAKHMDLYHADVVRDELVYVADADYSTNGGDSMFEAARSLSVERFNTLSVTDADLIAISEHLLDNALDMLGSSPDIRHLVDSRLKHQALGAYLTKKVQEREAKLEAANNLNEIRIRHERQIGFEIRGMQERGELATRQNARKVGSTTSEVVDPVDEILSLADLSISHNQSSRWQQLTLLPDDEFNEHIADAKVNGWELTTAGVVKHARNSSLKERRERLAESVIVIAPSDRWHVEVADMRTYTTSQQFDFIITDPPYPREYLELYEVLARRANDWLKPDGLLIAMAGQSYLDQIIASMSRHLTYYWTAAYLTPGQPTPLRQRQVNTSWKPLLIFSRGDYKGKIFGDVFTSGANDKSLHEWGQSESGMQSIVSQICLPGESVFDPFLGAGTTGVAALRNGCLFTGIDIDAQNVEIAKVRLHEHTQAQQ